MLVLSRKVNEDIVITAGDYTIRITVVELRGEKVRIGVKAPPQVSVHRGEIQDLIEKWYK